MFLFGIFLRFGICASGFSAPVEPGVSSPDGNLLFKLQLKEGALQYAVSFKNKSVIEFSPMHFTLDGVKLTDQLKLSALDPYHVNETYDWRGTHSRATNNYNGLKATFKNLNSDTSFILEVRSFNDAVAFRFIIPELTGEHVPDEATLFRLPAGSRLWYHDLEGHYEAFTPTTTFPKSAPAN